MVFIKLKPPLNSEISMEQHFNTFRSSLASADGCKVFLCGNGIFCTISFQKPAQKAKMLCGGAIGTRTLSTNKIYTGRFAAVSLFHMEHRHKV